MRKIIFLSAAIIAVLCVACPARAEIYQWTDKDGVVHMTNEPSKVPEEYRGQIKTFKPSKKDAQSAPPAAQQEPEKGAGLDLYGGETLEWWKENFRKKREDAQAIEQGVSAKKDFIRLFEGGRRTGQIFDAKDVDRYETYRKELPSDEARLKALKDEIDELVRRAKINGVPRVVYGE